MDFDDNFSAYLPVCVAIIFSCGISLFLYLFNFICFAYYYMKCDMNMKINMEKLLDDSQTNKPQKVKSSDIKRK